MPINPVYLEKEMQEQIRKVLEKEKVALLFDFLEEGTYLEIVQMLHTLPFTHEKEPLTHSFSRAVLPPTSQNKTIFSPLHPSWNELLAFLSGVLNKKIKTISFIPYSFTWKDYALLHDEILEKPGIDIIFDATPHWDTAWGGAITYSNADVPGTVHRLPTGKNQLAIVIRATSAEQRFVQYLNHYAEGKKKIFLLGKV